MRGAVAPPVCVAGVLVTTMTGRESSSLLDLTQRNLKREGKNGEDLSGSPHGLSNRDIRSERESGANDSVLDQFLTKGCELKMTSSQPSLLVESTT